MDFHNITVLVLSSIIGILIGLKIDNIFIKRTRNRKPYLTRLGIHLFGKNKGKYSEFVKPHKAVLIKVIDIIVALIIIGIVQQLSMFIIEKTYIFYIPLLIISLTSGYLAIRGLFEKIKWKEWLWIALSYFIGFVLVFFIIWYKL